MLNRTTRRQFLRGISGVSIAMMLPAVALAPADAQAASGTAVDAARRALAGDYAAAGTLAAQSGDSSAIKLVELFYLRDHGSEAGYSRIMAFLNAAPDWPLNETLMKRAEKALYDNSESPAVVSQHFANRKPSTAYGNIAMARVAYASGNAAAGKTWLSKAWADSDVDADFEKKIAGEFGSKLSAGDHQQRWAQLIFDQKGESAARVAQKYLGGEYQTASNVAKALIDNVGGADKKFAGLSGGMKAQLPLLYVLTRWYRRHDNFDGARRILASVPGDPVAMGNAEAWQDERRSSVRRSVGPMQRANWKTAYTIAKNHGLTSGDGAIDGEFLAGWVALRYLNQPQLAMGHFLKLQKIATNGTERARAAYWIGRSQLALGQMAPAKAAFKTAAAHTSVYYGQLAREEIGLGNKPEEIEPPGSSDGAKAAVARDEMVRAAMLLAQADGKNRMGIFLMPLAKRFETTDQLNAVANMLQTQVGTACALRFAKASAVQGHDIDAWAYPIYGLPNWAQVGKPVEKSLVFALSRQESEFDPSAGSSVGAQGLMQLMPGTAKLVAKQYGIGFQAGKLKDADYNVKLGAAHLADLVSNLNGSYVLTLVGYNAGPRRATEWVSYFGDPRGGKVDAVDWVECIPFNETRQYVQKVMQNLHVYRSRLAPETVRPMTADLKRGSPDDVNVASTTGAIN